VNLPSAFARRHGAASFSSSCTDLAAIPLVLIGALAVASGRLALANGRRRFLNPEGDYATFSGSPNSSRVTIGISTSPSDCALPEFQNLRQ
jgi:hypothetical protein